MVTLWICIRELPGSNLIRVTTYSDVIQVSPGKFQVSAFTVRFLLHPYTLIFHYVQVSLNVIISI